MRNNRGRVNLKKKWSTGKTIGVVTAVLGIIVAITTILANLSEIGRNRDNVESFPAPRPTEIEIQEEQPTEDVVIVESSWEETATKDTEYPTAFVPKEGDLIEMCPPYQTDTYREWTNESIAGKNYASGICIGGFYNDSIPMWSNPSEGYALYNLSGEYISLSFDVGPLDSRAHLHGESLYIYLDNKLVWQFDLDPEALPTHHEIDLRDVQQMKIMGSKYAGDYTLFNLWISK